MASDPSPDLLLTPINGEGRTVSQWLTTFHLLLIGLDPYTSESSWVLPVAERTMRSFEQADVRVAWLVTADARDCERFLGPLSRNGLVFQDPEREVVKALGLQRLPAIVHLAMDGTVRNSAEGWHPATWRRVTDHLAKVTRWTGPTLGMPKDPGPFEGSPALA